MGYDVGVYNSYGHRSISCSSFLRCPESELFGDRREIKGSTHFKLKLNGARAMAVRSPYDFLRSPYDSRTMLGVRTILINLDITVRMPHDHPKGLRLSYYLSPQIIIKPCGDRTIIAGLP